VIAPTPPAPGPGPEETREEEDHEEEGRPQAEGPEMSDVERKAVDAWFLECGECGEITTVLAVLSRGAPVACPCCGAFENYTQLGGDKDLLLVTRPVESREPHENPDAP